MNTLCTYLIKQSGLVSDGVRAAGLAREANSPYERRMQERRRAREESERRGWEKLQNTLRTGQGYQDWMGEYFLDGLGLRNLKQLDDPRVQEYFLRKAEGKDPGNMHHIGLYQPAGFFKRRDSEGRLLNAAVEYIKNKRNAANANSQGSAQSVSTSTPTPAPAPAPTPKPAPAPVPSPNPAPNSPSLPGSTLTAGADVDLQAPNVDIPEFNATPTPSLSNSALTAGADIRLQAPSVDIPEFNPTPRPAAPAQATQNPFYDPKSITRQQMQQYRRYTGANNMNSDMDRWKTYQAMNGNRNASNADYYTAKKNNSLGAVKNPITQPK